MSSDFSRAVESLEIRRLLSIVYVDANSPAGSPNGSSWATAFPSLAPVLLAATSGTQILVADGTYKPTTNTDSTVAFRLKNGVSILGGYGGYGAMNPDARDFINTPTILSGDIGTTNLNTDNSYHVVIAQNTDATATLDGVTITAGYATAADPNFGPWGGGLLGEAGGATLNNCTITANTAPTASSLGGGMYLDGGDYHFNNCIFTNNVSGGLGGGAATNEGASAAFINCAFLANTAPYGGAIFFATGAPQLLNCTFTRNTASTSGGAVGLLESSPAITNCIMYGDIASSFSEVFNDSSDTAPVISYSDVQGGATGTGNFNLDPKFVNAAGGNVQLQSASPCINAGNNSAIPSGDTTDLAGNARIQLSVVDVGAYESSVPHVIYVDKSAIGFNNGTDWYDAFLTVQLALNSATRGTQILVAQGIYQTAGATNHNATFSIPAGVAVYGEYRGGQVNPGDRSVGYPTQLSGQTADSFHVVTITNTNSADAVAPTILDGFQIVDGDDTSAPSQTDGAGLLITGSSPTINQCSFINDVATVSGQDVEDDFGGGIYVDGASSPAIGNCTFLNCYADCGGGIANRGAATINNCTFTINRAGDVGGAICQDATGVLTVTNCTFQGNSAFEDGGAVCALHVGHLNGLTMIDCAFVGNTSTGTYGGGAIADAAPNLVLLNDSFTNNQAYSGIQPGERGGAVDITDVGDTTVGSITNCIFWQDYARNAPEISIDGSASISITNNDIQGGGFAGTGNINSDPMFFYGGRPGDDGVWGTGDDVYGDLRVQSISPCIDAGSNSAVDAAAITTDILGNARKVDFPGVNDPGAIVDMGAYEAFATILAGTGAADHYYAELTSDGLTLQVWNSTSPSGSPNETYDLRVMYSFILQTGNGDDSFEFDTTNDCPKQPINFDGGAGNDTLFFTGLGGGTQFESYPDKSLVRTHTIAHTFNETNVEIVSLTAPIGSPITLAQLSLLGGSLTIPQGGHHVFNAGPIFDGAPATSVLDLNDNDLIVHDPGPGHLPEIQALINSARDGGAWDGPGITSSSAKNINHKITTLGAMTIADYQSIYGINATFDGQDLFDQMILVKYTYYGDANFNGKVDGGDYTQMDLTFGHEATQGNIGGWFNGDFDGDGRVNGSDYALADLAFGNQTTVFWPALPPALPPAFPPAQMGGGRGGLGSSRT